MLSGSADGIAGQRIELFIRSMKNDTYAEGNYISLAWITASGVEIGRMLQLYLACLTADGVSSDQPLFVPTQGNVYSPIPLGNKSSRFNHIVKDLLRHFLKSLSVERLAQFSFHSLRRVGASHARLRGVPPGLVSLRLFQFAHVFNKKSLPLCPLSVEGTW